MSQFSIVGLVVAGLVVFVALLALRKMVNIVQQGEVGVVKRLGEYRRTHEPGLVIIAPFIDSLQRVDMREIPRPGDRQDVITKDNVVVTSTPPSSPRSSTPSRRCSAIANFDIAIDALARTALRSVIGTMTLDQALSERERINTDVQQQMEAVTDKWGIRINRIEIVEIAAAAEDPRGAGAAEAGRPGEAGQDPPVRGPAAARRSTSPRATPRRRSAGPRASAQAAILRAEGARQAAILEAEGRSQAITTVYGAIKKGEPDPTLVAILQLDTLAKFAESDNAKIVVPFESAGLLGAAQALRGVLGSMPAGTNGVDG